jgi:hypothetical protein
MPKLHPNSIKYLKSQGHLDSSGHATLYNIKAHESHKIHHDDLEFSKYKNGVHGIHGTHKNGSKSVRLVGRKITV